MDTDWNQIYTHILTMEQQGLVTRTFRRLDPERQQAVIAAILEEAGEHGPAEVNIKQVAGRAGVSVGSLYQYFGSRQGLLRFAIELVVQQVVDQFNSFRPYLAGLPLREALLAYLNGGLEWSQEQAAFARFFARAAYQGDPAFGQSVVYPIAASMRAIVTEILAAAQARRELRPGLDLEAAARVVNALTICTSDPVLLPYLNLYYQVTDETVTPERLVEAAIDLILRGITPP